MALSDAQIERFSRQIILPQIGASGQQRLLHSSAALAGDGALAEHVALYLSGAGIGPLALHGRDRERVRAELLDLNPEVQISLPSEAFGARDADVLIACDVAPDALERAAALRRPLVAGGAEADAGWLVVAADAGICAACAGRQATARRSPLRTSPGAAVGVVGSLMALAVLKVCLEIGELPRGWLQFDGVRSTLTEHPLVRATQCPACAG
jgi:molybdopterin-synthase adenylyltransferase